MSEQLPLAIREAVTGDRNMIMDSWKKNARNRPWHTRGIPSDVFFRAYDKMLRHLIPRSTVLVACDSEALDVIYGWVCAEVIDDALVIHYLYVKSAFKHGQGRKGFGIGRALLETLLRGERGLPHLVHTHETKAWGGFIDTLEAEGTIPPTMRVRYDPYILYSTLPHGWYA